MIQEIKSALKTSGLSAKVFIVSVVCAMLVTVLTGLTVVSNTVTIHEDGYAYTRYTIYTELEDILTQEEIEIGPDDTCVFTGFEDNKADIYITRAFAVSVTADNTTQSLFMSTGTVEDALHKAGVTVAEEDLINVSLSEPVVDSMHIEVSRVTYEETEETVEIPFDTIETEDVPSAHGRIDVVVEGETGEKLVKKKLKYVDGELVKTTVLSEEVLKEPVAQEMGVIETVYIGGKKVDFLKDRAPIRLDANGIPVNYAYKVTGKAVAYSALGKATNLEPGDVAMDLSKFPRGTKLYIRSTDGSYVYGYSTVSDTGTAVASGTVLVDCFFNTYWESVQFGAKQVEVYVLG